MILKSLGHLWTTAPKEAPPILRDFLTYHETIQGHSRKTVDEYYLDLRNFFRFLKQNKNLIPKDMPLDDVSIDDADLALVRDVTLTDIYSYMNYLSRDRGLNNASRARKVATIRSFYKYLTNKAKLLDTNPVQDLDSPRLKKSLPKYLNLDESLELLDSVDGKNSTRDYCILTLFLNCGLRISALVSLNKTTFESINCGYWAKATRNGCCTSTTPVSGRWRTGSPSGIP